MKNVNIENLTVNLVAEEAGVRIKSDVGNILLVNQDIDNVVELIRSNFKIVEKHYEQLVNRTDEIINMLDIYYVSLSIVLHYLYLYNFWRTNYKKQENRNLKFKEEDFNHPSTHDIIFHYFRLKYPTSWKVQSAVLLGIGLDEVERYYKEREEFYNK